jgi:hypothetical protein
MTTTSLQKAIRSTPSGSAAGPTSERWILNLWSDLLLFVATPLLIIPLVFFLCAVDRRRRPNDRRLRVLVWGFGASFPRHDPGLRRPGAVPTIPGAVHRRTRVAFGRSDFGRSIPPAHADLRDFDLELLARIDAALWVCAHLRRQGRLHLAHNGPLGLAALRMLVRHGPGLLQQQDGRLPRAVLYLGRPVDSAGLRAGLSMGVPGNLGGRLPRISRQSLFADLPSTDAKSPGAECHQALAVGQRHWILVVRDGVRRNCHFWESRCSRFATMSNTWRSCGFTTVAA